MSVGRVYLTVFAVAVPLQFAWEMAQAPFYGPMGSAWQATRRCFLASVGDGLMTLGVVVAGSLIFGSVSWFVERRSMRYVCASCAALALAVAVESWGLTTERWAYGDEMPLVPATRLGVLPLIQMASIVPLTLALAASILRRRRTRRAS